MRKFKYHWVIGALIMILSIALSIWLFMPKDSTKAMKDPWTSVIKTRHHLDHARFFTQPFKRPQDVTKSCLQCHPQAAKDLMKTVHWKWEGDPVKIPGHKDPMKIGKKNLINNFCLGITGNWSSCTSCHAGYGWENDSFDFTKEENVDCLICHDWSGTYAKGPSGFPREGVDLLAVAQKVGYPRRDNCGICHIYGGGGMGVKHGDLDNTLVNPSENLDIHMGKFNFLCVDCHKTTNHNIKGKAYSVSINHENGILCTDCHDAVPHRDSRINTHLSSVACQTCHIPLVAKKAPTKTDWDWSKAGDASRSDDPHTYLKIKGEFIYKKNLRPEYAWFNLNSERYILGDKIDPSKVVYINKPIGDITDPTALIWPFKIHRAKQPYDMVNNYLLVPNLSGQGGFWHDFDWEKALQQGGKNTGMNFSGKYGFADTEMHWPLSHMVAPSTQALKCNDCHGDHSIMNWKELGYDGDPERYGGRITNTKIKNREGV